MVAQIHLLFQLASNTPIHRNSATILHRSSVRKSPLLHATLIQGIICIELIICHYFGVLQFGVPLIVFDLNYPLFGDEQIEKSSFASFELVASLSVSLRTVAAILGDVGALPESISDPDIIMPAIGILEIPPSVRSRRFARALRVANRELKYSLFKLK